MEEITAQHPLCSQCSAEIIEASKFCTHCGFPENGDEKEKAIFHAKKAMKKNQVKDDHEKINSARNTLYWMAYWSQKKPFAALLSALLLYLMVIAINAIVEPTTIFKGILIKIIILSFLIKGVSSAHQGAKE